MAGFGYHGDFMMGWDEDFLQKAVKTCTNDSGRIEDCPLFDIMSKEAACKCEMEKPLPEILKNEDIKGPMPKLPGGGGARHGSSVTPKVEAPKNYGVVQKVAHLPG